MKTGRHISIMLQFRQKKSCDNSNIHKDNLDFYKNMLLFFTLYIKWINLEVRLWVRQEKTKIQKTF